MFYIESNISPKASPKPQARVPAARQSPNAPRGRQGSGGWGAAWLLLVWETLSAGRLGLGLQREDRSQLPCSSSIGFPLGQVTPAH